MSLREPPAGGSAVSCGFTALRRRGRDACRSRGGPRVRAGAVCPDGVPGRAVGSTRPPWHRDSCAGCADPWCFVAGSGGARPDAARGVENPARRRPPSPGSVCFGIRFAPDRPESPSTGLESTARPRGRPGRFERLCPACGPFHGPTDGVPGRASTLAGPGSPCARGLSAAGAHPAVGGRPMSRVRPAGTSSARPTPRVGESSSVPCADGCWRAGAGNRFRRAACRRVFPDYRTLDRGPKGCFPRRIRVPSCRLGPCPTRGKRSSGGERRHRIRGFGRCRTDLRAGSPSLIQGGVSSASLPQFEMPPV